MNNNAEKQYTPKGILSSTLHTRQVKFFAASKVYLEKSITGLIYNQKRTPTRSRPSMVVGLLSSPCYIHEY